MASAGTSYRERILVWIFRIQNYSTLVAGVLLCCEQGREELDVGKECVVSSQRPGQYDVCDGGAGDDLLLGLGHR